MNQEDRKIHQLLLDYVKKLENNTLTYEERMLLVHFYISNQTGTPLSSIECTFQDVENYLALGWYIHYLIEQSQNDSPNQRPNQPQEEEQS